MEMKIYSGTSGYGYKEWKGNFYPERIPAKEMLRFYSERLRTVEINNTFYRMPKESVLDEWAGQVPPDFIFSIKAPQIITHLKRLHNVDAETEHFFQTLSVLKNRLGPVLFQFPASFRVNLEALENFLALIPGYTLCAFEFRSASWPTPELLSLLRNKNGALCIADTDENPASEIISTATWGYLRLRRQAYTDADLSQCLEKIRSNEWEKAFVYFKHEGGAEGPRMAMRFQEMTSRPRRNHGW